MMNTLVSIIIPAFNYGHFLNDCISSLTNQEYKDWEAIIVDDGSTDNTREICEGLVQKDKRVRYIRQENQGQPAARNTGLASAKGSYIQFLDADDLIQPKKISSQVNFLKANTDTDIVFADVYYFESNRTSKQDLFLNRWDEPQKPWITKIEGSGEKLVNAYARKNLFELGCALFRHSAVSEIGNFDTSLKGVEDYDFCWRAAILGNRFSYAHEEEAAILMRHHPKSFSKNVRCMHKAEISLRNKNRYRLKSAGFTEAIIINNKQSIARLKKWKNLVISDYRRGLCKPTISDLLWFAGKTDPFDVLTLLAKLLKNTPRYLSNVTISSSHPKPQKSHSYSPAENEA